MGEQTTCLHVNTELMGAEVSEKGFVMINGENPLPGLCPKTSKGDQMRCERIYDSRNDKRYNR